MLTIGNQYSYSGLRRALKQSIPSIIGYAKKGQTEDDRRNSLVYLYQTEFQVEEDARRSLRNHVEEWGKPHSAKRFKRICSYLFMRGRSLIESHADKRSQGPHRSNRRIFETFNDGMWFANEFGAVGTTAFGIQHMIHLDEPLLMFMTEELGLYPVEHGNVRALNKDDERYNSHPELIYKRFGIRDFNIDADKLQAEWEKRGGLDSESEAAIAEAYLNDHIAPMRADAEDHRWVSGNSARRFRLDEGKPDDPKEE